MSDIQVGDVVECVATCSCREDHEWVEAPPTPVGSVLRVAALCHDESDCVGLWFTGNDMDGPPYCCGYYRKITAGKLEFTGLTERKVPAE